MILKTAIFTGLFCAAALAQYGQCKLDDKSDGFCTMGSGTTGGAGGRIVRIKDYQSLHDALESTEKLIVEIEGTIDLKKDNLSLRSNKTIIGIGENATLINGGLETYRQTNIIIRNITFVNAPDDLLKINQETTNIWIDHCTFSDGTSISHDTDGLLDITRGSDYITISWCKFFNHDKCILIGHVDNEKLDAGKLRVTMHHNWFNETVQRHPRVRQGSVHVYNNYYVKDSIYGIVSANNAKVLVEANYFLNVKVPTQLGVPGFSGPGDLKEVNNIYKNCGEPQATGIAFDPSSYYKYTADNPAVVPEIVMAKAGAGGIKPVGTIQTSRLHSRAAIQNDALSRSASAVYAMTGKKVLTVPACGTMLSKGTFIIVDRRSDLKTANKIVNVSK